MSAAQHPADDLDELRALLTADAERLAEVLLGQPTKGLSTKKTLRFGANGSLAVELRGRKRGEWFSHETGAGGGVFDLISHAHGCKFADAVKWARTWLGAPSDAPRPKPRPVPDRAAQDAEEAAERARAIDTARGMAHAAGPMAGTVAETYVVTTRGILAPATGWPDAIRFHAPTRSLLAVATLADGAVQAVQRVRLTPSAQKVDGTPEHPTKVTNGRQDGALVRLPERADVSPALRNVLLLAEGPENGLSVWTATGCETWLVFGVGQFQHVEIPAGRHAVLCRDDDRQHSAADKAVRKAVTGWRTGGSDVVVATPWPDRRGDKSDFNNALQAGGATAVLARILPHAPNQPDPPATRVPVETARAQIDAAVREFFASALVFDPDMEAAENAVPPVHGIKVSVGVGKSHAARHHLVEMVATMRRRGDKRNVALAVPTHRLGSEQASMFQELPALRAAGLTVAVWRGRSAPNPDHADFKDPNVADTDKAAMCGNLGDVAEAQAHGLRVDETACRRLVKTADGEKVAYECPLYAECAYQAQKRRHADIWLVAHEMLFTTKPAALGNLAAVVVDESPWQAALEGITGRGDRMPLDSLRGSDAGFRDAGSPDWVTLQHHRSRALDALQGMTEGPVLRDLMEAEGLTAKDAAEARALELNRLVDPKIHPGMSRAQRAELFQTAAENKAVMQRARFWRTMEALLVDGGPVASGWAYRDVIETPDGPCNVVRLRGRKPVRKGWTVPTLAIDALLHPELVRPLWPQVEMVADVQAETPHQHVRQVIDRSYSKSRLDPLDDEKAKADPEEARRRVRNLREARAILCREARKHRAGRVLAVAQKGVREAMEGLGPLPRNLTLGHHNAVAGRDEWGDVAGLVVLGRTAPPPADVERMCEALTGTAVTPIAGWYPRVPVSREMAGAPGMASETDRHPDPLCEAIRWHITEGELVQIIGRGRGVNRNAGNPLHVLVMTDAPLPVPVHEAIGFADLAPCEADRMLAETGFSFDNPSHAAVACPALWGTREAAKKALEREVAKRGRLGTNPYKELFIGECPQPRTELQRADYQPKGAGKSAAVAWFDPLMVADPETALRRLLGDLAWCRVAPDPQPSRPPGVRLVVSAGLAPDPQPETHREEPMTEPLSITRVPANALFPTLEPVLGVFTIRRRDAAPLAVVETPSGLRVAEGEAPPENQSVAKVVFAGFSTGPTKRQAGPGLRLDFPALRRPRPPIAPQPDAMPTAARPRAAFPVAVGPPATDPL